MPVCTLIVDNPDQGSIRLDTYAASKIPDNISRSRLKAGLKNLTINGKNAKLSAKLKYGDTVIIEWEDPVPQEIIPQEIPLDIVFEDDNVTIINKKQGMVTHPANGNWDGTLVNALLHHWGKEAVVNKKEGSLLSVSARRPGIVHRLDKDTSGTIITAKNRNTETYLQEQFKKRRVKKEYIAIVKGHPPLEHGSIKTNLVRDSIDRKKFTTTLDKEKGKFSHTVYTCIAVYGPYSLMKLTLKTGRTHQIRVHMKYLGCPILGDPMYGVRDSQFKSATLMLHSYKLGIRLPDSTLFTEYTSPVPIRFKKVMQYLHKTYERTSIFIRKNT